MPNKFKTCSKHKAPKATTTPRIAFENLARRSQTKEAKVNEKGSKKKAQKATTAPRRALEPCKPKSHDIPEESF